MLPATLLHVGQAVAGVTAVDARALAAGVLAAVAALAIAWSAAIRDLGRMVLRRRRARLALSATGWTLALLAVLPSAVPYDHLLAAAHGAQSDEAHAAHCHQAPASCADAPLPAGPGQLLSSEPLMPAPALLAVLLAGVALVLVGVSSKPDVPPPLALIDAATV